MPPETPPAGWSSKASDASVVLEEAAICRASGAARGTRGYQVGRHRFGVRLLTAGGPCWMGLASARWRPHQVLGVEESWALAADGSTWAGGRELERLPLKLEEDGEMCLQRLWLKRLCHLDFFLRLLERIFSR